MRQAAPFVLAPWLAVCPVLCENQCSRGRGTSAIPSSPEGRSGGCRTSPSLGCAQKGPSGRQEAWSDIPSRTASSPLARAPLGPSERCWAVKEDMHGQRWPDTRRLDPSSVACVVKMPACLPATGLVTCSLQTLSLWWRQLLPTAAAPSLYVGLSCAPVLSMQTRKCESAGCARGVRGVLCVVCKCVLVTCCNLLPPYSPAGSLQ